MSIQVESPEDELDVDNFYEQSAKQNFSAAREKAQRQLALSSDSPFSNIEKEVESSIEQVKRAKEQRAAQLAEETINIRNQLDEIKNRLVEIQRTKESQSIDESKQPQSQAKFRPLTGKADCPNCTCDRRSSVCDKCVNLATTSSQIRTENRLSSLQSDPTLKHPDDRPIRPALNARFKARVEPAPIDRNLIPNQVFTISRSLDNKRTKLAQAIDVLQLEINKVKERGNRAEQERKLAQLYRNQWKFGPSVGGPRASARDRLGKDQQSQGHDYQSRMDPNLRRDTKSLMAFRHVGSNLKLRQYSSGSSTNLANSRDKRPSSRSTSSPSRLTATRSQSVECLRADKQPAGVETGRSEPPVRDLSKIKSSSNVDLATNRQPSADDTEVAEELEDCLAADQSSPDNGSSDERQSVIEATREDQRPTESSANENVQKMSWVPVFGETEIKTIRKAPKRKLQIISPPSSAKVVSSNVQPKSTQPLPRARAQLATPKSILSSRERPSLQTDDRQDRLVSEAEKKLKFASDLLAREMVDSKTKNQLLVNKSAPIPKPRQTTVKSVMTSKDRDVPKSVPVRKELNPSEVELQRLEEMVNEQQRLLNRLAASQNGRLSPAIVSPITVSCPSPCCCNRGCKPEISKETATNKSSLVIALKDRLNKTKLRLARRLEEERERHQQLQLKVDSSLRKQTDLETENDILKQSLSKCIDTCLKDISNTFESIADTLASSIGPKASVSSEEQATTTTATPLDSAARLITENRYLKDMQRHVEKLEQQRREIFDELSKEKQKAAKLETHLRQSRLQLEQLSAIVKDRFNYQEEGQSPGGLGDSTHEQVSSIAAGSGRQMDEPTVGDKSQSDETLTYSSTQYSQLIEPISLDMEAINRHHQLMLDEVDNLKKLLPSMEE